MNKQCNCDLCKWYTYGSGGAVYGYCTKLGLYDENVPIPCESFEVSEDAENEFLLDL